MRQSIAATKLTVGQSFKDEGFEPYRVTRHRVDDDGHACFSFVSALDIEYSCSMGPARMVEIGYTNRKAKRQRCKARRRAQLRGAEVERASLPRPKVSS